ncbi:uncharacterized protein LOC142225536 isoform X2 [Haematobia irritans]
MPAIRAFQTPNTSLHHMSTSPLLTSSRSHLINEMSPLPVQKSQLSQVPRTVNMSRRSTIQETSFSNKIDTEAVVNKIQNMFPTASENHIRLLLKKYYNREAVVISALQVEKHPVTMPGPFVTPPGQRHLFHSNSTIHTTPPVRRYDNGAHVRCFDIGLYNSCNSRTTSPVLTGRLGSAMSVNSGNIGSLVLQHFHGSPYFGDQLRNSPKPHSSPKMKLRYMKMIYPKADETLLLDVLANSDNNVQTASEKISSLGYTKKEFIPQQKIIIHSTGATGSDQKTSASEENTTIPLRPKELTETEKCSIKQRLQKLFPLIVEHVIVMALESVNYVEDRAIQILQLVHEEEELRTKSQTGFSHEMAPYFENTSADSFDVQDGVDVCADRTKNYISPVYQDAISDTKENTKHNKTDSTYHHFEASLGLNLSSVKMSTKSILDRYRKISNTTANHYIRGACTSNTFWNKVSHNSRDKSDSLKHSQRDYSDPSTDKLCNEFKSIMGRVQCNGPNYKLSKGADESLLLADYVTWNGANPEYLEGQRNLAIGPNSALLSKHSYKACGPDRELWKGPQTALAKGSIYKQASTSKTIDIKCN